jgi:hypothetical protein
MKTWIFILALLCCTICRAQSVSTNDSTACNFNIKLSYISSIIYPGISTGIEFPLHNYYVQILKRQEYIKSFTKGRFISGNINWYHHPYFHDNLYLTAEWVMRRTKNTGFISEFSAGPGYSRTFLGGTTYKVDDNGNISIIRLAGSNYALITVLYTLDRFWSLESDTRRVGLKVKQLKNPMVYQNKNERNFIL